MARPSPRSTLAFALFAQLFACSASDHVTGPPVFGGEGAVVANERPLPPETAAPAAANAGPCKGPAPVSETALFDDFEDADNKPFKGFEREGWWWSAMDTTPNAKISPPMGTFGAERLPPAEAVKDNLFAAHFSAEGQKEWGAVWGSTLAWTNGGIKCPFNASGFDGVKLRAKGNKKIRVTLGMPETIGGDGGGNCKQRCYDSHGKDLFLSETWQEYEIPWQKLQQQGWGAEARFNPARLIQIAFKADVKDLPVDLWIDDIVFLPKQEAASKAP